MLLGWLVLAAFPIATPAFAVLVGHLGTKGVQPGAMRVVFATAEVDPTFTTRFGDIYDGLLTTIAFRPLSLVADRQNGDRDQGGPALLSGPRQCDGCTADMTLHVRVEAPTGGAYRVTLEAQAQGRRFQMQTERPVAPPDLFIRSGGINPLSHAADVRRSVLNDLEVLGAAVCMALTQQPCAVTEGPTIARSPSR